MVGLLARSKLKTSWRVMLWLAAFTFREGLGERLTNLRRTQGAISAHRFAGKSDLLAKALATRDSELQCPDVRAVVGNRTTMTVGMAALGARAYVDVDQLTSVTPAGESAISYSWDDNGNLTDRGSDEFEWDYEDRMTSATVDSADDDLCLPRRRPPRLTHLQQHHHDLHPPRP